MENRYFQRLAAETLYEMRPYPRSVDDRTHIVIDYVVMAIGFAGMALALIGEWRGWWNDFGVVVAVVSFGLTLWSGADINGRRLLGRFQRQEHRMDAALDRQDAMLGKQDTMLEKQDLTNALLVRVVSLLDERLPVSR